MTTSELLGMLRVYGLIGLVTTIAAFIFGISGVVLIGEQVTYWLKEAVWRPNPLLTEIGPIHTGLKGVDVIIVSVLDRFSTGAAAMILGFVLGVVSMVFYAWQQDADQQRAKLKPEKRRQS